MANDNKKRKKMMDYLTMVFNTLDTSGDTAKSYQDKFRKMSNEEFFMYFESFFNDPKRNFYVEIIEYERDISIEDIMKTAEVMNVPLFEYVAKPSDSGGPTEVTPEPVPVGYIHVKRMPQTLMKKSAGSTKIEKRSALTGQVTGDDKNARNSNLETYCLATLEANEALKEFMGPRADNMLAKSQLYSDIAKNGHVSLDDLNLDDPYYKVGLNTFDTYHLMQGIKTNLITNLNELPKPK